MPSSTHRSEPGSELQVPASRGPAWLPLLASLAIVALAYFSPVEMVDSDPAIALLVSQAILDHQSLRLDPYRDDPRLAYDLDDDYRLRRRGDERFYYSPSVAVLSLPFVRLANHFGVHMLDQAAEYALQNLLSALCCGAIFLLLHGACRALLPPLPSLVISGISVLGSPLMSTVASGLWNSGYAALFTSLAVLHLARRSAGEPAAAPNLVYLGAVLAAGFVARPAVAFAILALLIYLLGEADRRLRWLAGSGLAGIALFVVLGWLDVLGWLLPIQVYYYSPTRLFTETPLLEGLTGTLISPSRGLFVFCPFLVAVAAGVVWRIGDLRQQRLVRFALIWLVLYAPAVATRPVWWGGHSFGPRLYTEVLPAFVLLTGLLWRRLDGALSSRARSAAIALYLALGAGAVAMHSGQALFNPYTRYWNERPNIDQNREYLFDWHHPQFLTTAARFERRLIDHQRRRLRPYPFGKKLAYDSERALFAGWSPPENGWRWSREEKPSLGLRLASIDPAALYILEVNSGALGRQEVGVAINDTPVADWRFEGFAPSRRLVTLPGALLLADQENTIRFRIPGATRTEGDPRRLGLALHSFRLFPLATDFAGIDYLADTWLGQGFSDAESSWRWTDGPWATLIYPTVGLGEGPHAFELTAGTLGRQRVEVFLDDQPLADLVFDGFEPVTQRLEIAAGRLQSNRLHRLRLELPDASATAEDRRQLGLAFRSLRLVRRP